MNDTQPYPIGIPGKPWGANERAEWLAQQQIKRSYDQQVLQKMGQLAQEFARDQYGALSCAPDRYPLFALKTRCWDSSNPAILVTGGVHGYETSGVQGAIRFLEVEAKKWQTSFNIVVAPCVSPWGYETINRWNPGAVDPNRSFRANSPSEEAAALLQYLDSLAAPFLAHIDLHETTNSDNTEFRPALAARDCVEHKNWHIPDGFYLVDDTEKSSPDFQLAMIRSVEQVTHIAPDVDGKIIGETIQQRGVIEYRARELGLCMGATEARFVSTTEVYPDSPRVDDENCIQAQVAAVRGALEFLTRE